MGTVATASNDCASLFVYSDELIDMYKAFAKDFPVISIEDPFDQDDIEHSKKLTAEGVCQVSTLSVGTSCVAVKINVVYCNWTVVTRDPLASV
jgi:enolase